MRTRWSRFGVCTIAVAGSLLAACGDDDDSSGATAPPATSATTAQSTTPAESAIDSDSSSAASPDTVAAPAGPATGEPIKLKSDGSFTVRLAMPDKRQVLPVVASTSDGVEQRTKAFFVHAGAAAEYQQAPQVRPGIAGPKG